MTDREALELLRLIYKYADEYSEDITDSISDMVADLAMSMDVTSDEADALRAGIEVQLTL